MSFEFVHTSVAKGLRGDSGFAVAVATRGLPPALEPALAELSAYDFDGNRAVGADAIDWAHRILSVAGRSYTVLSRTAPCGSDWSGRPNRIAHHIVVEAHERAAAGPAWMLSAFSGFHESSPAVGEPASGPVLPVGDAAPRPAANWDHAGFDPGWAGIVAQTLLDAPGAVCCVVLPESVSALPLALDVFALLPGEKRWLVTFSTRFQRLPAGGRCQLRFLRAGATGVRSMLAEPGVRVIEVAHGAFAGDGAAARAAREGRVVEATVREAPSTRVNPVLRGAPVLEEIDARPPRARRPEQSTEQSAEESAERSAERSDFEPRVSSDAAFGSAATQPAFGPVDHAGREHPRIEPRLRADPPAAAAHRALLVAVLLFAYSAVALAVATALFIA